MSNKQSKNLSVISSDFVKAFDRADWDFIFSALQKFEFGESFVNMI